MAGFSKPQSVVPARFAAVSLVVINKCDWLPEAGPHHRHQHAAAATMRSPGPVEPGLLTGLLENPPYGAYRIKGRVAVQSGRGCEAMC
jgi:hypothetical protein